MLRLGSSGTGFKANIGIQILIQIISRSSGVGQRESVGTTFPNLEGSATPVHVIVSYGPGQTRITVTVRVGNHSRVVPVEFGTIFHFVSIY